MRICNQLSGQLLHAKLYLNEKKKLVVASEFFYRSEEDFEYLLHEGLQAIIAGKKRFLELYKPIEEGSKFLSNLEASKFFSDNSGNV